MWELILNCNFDYDERVQTRRQRLVLFGQGPMVFRALSSKVQMHKRDFITLYLFYIVLLSPIMCLLFNKNKRMNESIF